MRSSIGVVLVAVATQVVSGIVLPWGLGSLWDDAAKKAEKYIGDHTANMAPLFQSANAIDDHYIVVFHPHAQDVDAHHSWLTSLHQRNKRDQVVMRADGLLGAIKHTYDIAEGAVRGYAGRFDERVIERIREHPDVAYVERDQVVHTMKEQKDAPWGLARISHKKALTFSTFTKYDYDQRDGEGVTAYIIDTGVNVKHEDFGGRAVWGATIPDGDDDADGNGHGTHVAGTVAGKKYGVAKKANVVAVKVLRSNGSGSMSDVLKGVEWAADAAIAEQKKAKKDAKKSKYKGSTANMSLGGGESRALNEAVDNAVKIANLHFAVAAGNDNADACNYSPAMAKEAITVGASTLADERAYFSNYGKCTDVFAPGLNILSTWIGGKDATNTISGTSMASPHICGLLSYLLSITPLTNATAAANGIVVSPRKMKKHLIDLAISGKLDGIPSDTVNLMAWNGGVTKNGTAPDEAIKII